MGCETSNSLKPQSKTVADQPIRNQNTFLQKSKKLEIALNHNEAFVYSVHLEWYWIHI